MSELDEHESAVTYGFIVVTGSGVLLGTLKGTRHQVLYERGVTLPKKHSKGGQSRERFARLREELNNGRSLGQAVDEGFRRAWMSIRDSHVTTLLGALILYIFTTSIVKGFALTLGIGVLMSLFSSIIITRAFLNLTVRPFFEKFKWLF